MKKMFFIVAGIAAMTGAAIYASSNTQQTLSCTLDEIEAEAGCEIKDSKGNIVFECAGNDEKRCSESWMWHTLTCNGQRVK